MRINDKGKMPANLERKISESVSQMNAAQQRRILSFIQFLALRPKTKARQNPLLHFAGAIEPQDINLMEKAIKEGCENIDAHEW